MHRRFQLAAAALSSMHSVRHRSQVGFISVWIVITAALFAQSTAHAHHSPSNYDHRRNVTITGTVVRLEWANPHVYTYVEQVTDAGKMVWQIEGLPPALLRRMGWHRDTLRVGDVISVTGSPAKNPNSTGLFPRLIKRGESTLFALNEVPKLAAQKAATRANGLNGVWSTPFTSVAQIGSPPAATLTAQGAEASRHYDEKTSPTSNCIPLPAPSWMFIPELKRITVGADAIDIESESAGARRIHLDISSHEGAIPSIQGHSIGKWEGKTLVVDTTHFAYHGAGNGGGSGIGPGLPSSTRKHLIERFTPGADGTSLTYSYEVIDREYLAVPRTGSVQFTHDPPAKFEVERCSLETARRFIEE